MFNFPHFRYISHIGQTKILHVHVLVKHNWADCTDLITCTLFNIGYDHLEPSSQPLLTSWYSCSTYLPLPGALCPRQILIYHAIPSGHRLIGPGFVFHQDNDPKHTSKAVKTYLETEAHGLGSTESRSQCNWACLGLLGWCKSQSKTNKSHWTVESLETCLGHDAPGSGR